MYADYDYYVNEFYGALIPEEQFSRSAVMAGRYLDSFTYGRINDENKDEIKGLKDCICDMAESVYKMLYASKSTGEKKSETIDGYSVTYAVEQKDGESVRAALKRNLYAVATLYLADTGLLYAGVIDCADQCICDCL